MPTDHTEKGFEQAIESHVLNHGYVKGDSAGRSRGIRGG
jgi:hypothetical protein